jgi:threonine dehydrogenase-like Zn-dependent dehydrogenase
MDVHAQAHAGRRPAFGVCLGGPADAITAMSAPIAIPSRQSAIQLVGPDKLEVNSAKPVHRPGPTQILGKVECVGLCFSDMKLLHQFDGHVRKSPVLKHLSPEVLKEIPSYVPGDQPTVPGHEVVIRVVETGAQVTSVKTGGRYLVQADWRDLRTASSNGAFGYNFEGGLQEFVLLDERTTVAADGTSYLVPVPDERSASQLALVEPWACVEEAFIHRERQTLKPGGTVLLVVSPGTKPSFHGMDFKRSAKLLCLGSCTPPEGFTCVRPEDVADKSVDDLLFAGADAGLLEQVVAKVANEGLVLVAQCEQRFLRPVNLPLGRVHYGNVRFAGDTGANFREALRIIPSSGEVRPHDHVHVIGAAGPMGSMAVIRLLFMDTPGLSVEGIDRNKVRLESFVPKAEALAKLRGVPLRMVDIHKDHREELASYHMVMVPVPAVVAECVRESRRGGIVNIFAGIPADVSGPIDLDMYCGKHLYFIGTSGSTMEDMEVVLTKVLEDRLDTNLSVGAVSGMGGAITGLEAVKGGKIAGKVLVYPELGDFPMTELPDLAAKYPTVGAKLSNGNWTKDAELELLKVAGRK